MMMRERPSYQKRIRRIKAGLKRQGMSQTKAALALGYSPALVCQLLRLQSTSRPLIEKLEALIAGGGGR